MGSQFDFSKCSFSESFAQDVVSHCVGITSTMSLLGTSRCDRLVLMRVIGSVSCCRGLGWRALGMRVRSWLRGVSRVWSADFMLTHWRVICPVSIWVVSIVMACRLRSLTMWLRIHSIVLIPLLSLSIMMIILSCGAAVTTATMNSSSRLAWSPLRIFHLKSISICLVIYR